MSRKLRCTLAELATVVKVEVDLDELAKLLASKDEAMEKERKRTALKRQLAELDANEPEVVEVEPKPVQKEDGGQRDGPPVKRRRKWVKAGKKAGGGSKTPANSGSK